MATTRLLARALNLKHIDTVTIAGTWAQGDTIAVECNSRDFVVTIGTLVTLAQVATTLKEAYNGETLTDTAASCVPSAADKGGQSIPELAELVATVAAAVVTLTGRVAGVPHALAVTETTAGDGTATLANVTAASGISSYDNGDNWTEGSTPAVDDLVYLDNEDTPILYGLSNAGATLDAFTAAANYTGTIGLPKQNANGYTEFRDDYLAIDSDIIKVGTGEGQGSGRLKFDCGTVQNFLEILKTGASTETGIPSVLWKGTNASNVINLKDGSLGVAFHGGEVATVATYRQMGGSAILGSGCTLGAITVEGGTCIINSAVTTLTVLGGEVVIYGTGAITTLTVLGGRVRCMTSGTIATLNVGGRGPAIIDFSGDATPRTITNTNIDIGGDLLLIPGTLTFTNKPVLAANVGRLQAA